MLVSCVCCDLVVLRCVWVLGCCWCWVCLVACLVVACLVGVLVVWVRAV